MSKKIKNTLLEKSVMPSEDLTLKVINITIISKSLDELEYGSTSRIFILFSDNDIRKNKILIVAQSLDKGLERFIHGFNQGVLKAGSKAKEAFIKDFLCCGYEAEWVLLLLISTLKKKLGQKTLTCGQIDTVLHMLAVYAFNKKVSLVNIDLAVVVDLTKELKNIETKKTSYNYNIVINGEVINW